MNTNSELVSNIRNNHANLYITEITNNDMKFLPEQHDGFVEYKRTLIDCTDKKAIQYATQMRWRITENIKHQCATYYIGVDDDGAIIGLTNDDIIACVTKIVSIAGTIDASITGIHIIHIGDLSIIKICVKIKKIKDNYLVDFNDDNIELVQTRA